MLRAADYVQKTDTGRQRRGNEDSSLARPPDVRRRRRHGRRAGRRGRLADRGRGVRAALPERARRRSGSSTAVQEANRQIYERSRTEHERAGMGTTLTAAYIDDAQVAIAHVGDSRAYLFRDGAADAADAGPLARRRAAAARQADRGAGGGASAALDHHPRARSRADGRGRPLDTIRCDADDVVLLCSDGLTSMISEEQIAEILGSTRLASSTAADQLIAEANAAGGRDNITVVLFRLEEVGADAQVDQPTMVGAPAPRTTPDPPPRRSPRHREQPVGSSDGTRAQVGLDAEAGPEAATGLDGPIHPSARRPTGAEARSRAAPACPMPLGVRPRQRQGAGRADPGRPAKSARKHRRYAKPLAALLATRDRARADRRRRLSRQPPAVLHRHQQPGDRDGLSRLPVRPAGGHQAVRDLLHLGRARVRGAAPTGARRCSTITCARRRTRPA